MATTPAPVQPPAPPPPPPVVTDAEAHYKSLLEYFKHLLWLTGIALLVVLGVGGYFLRSNVRDTLDDVRRDAHSQATNEVERRVSNAFDDKNINELVQKVARDKINAVTDAMIEQKVNQIADKMIEQQLRSSLQPIQQHILLIGRISECEARMHTGFRSGLSELTAILNQANDPDVKQFAQTTLSNTANGYESYWQTSLKSMLASNAKPIDIMRMQLQRPGLQMDATDLSGVVRVRWTRPT